MFIILMVIALIGLILGLVAGTKNYHGSAIPGTVVIVSLVLLIICLIASLFCIVRLVDGKCLPEKIEMYEELRANTTPGTAAYDKYTQEIIEAKEALLDLKAPRWWLYLGK